MKIRPIDTDLVTNKCLKVFTWLSQASQTEMYFTHHATCPEEDSASNSSSDDSDVSDNWPNDHMMKDEIDSARTARARSIVRVPQCSLIKSSNDWAYGILTLLVPHFF